jgi:hypothetical protein
MDAEPLIHDVLADQVINSQKKTLTAWVTTPPQEVAQHCRAHTKTSPRQRHKSSAGARWGAQSS